MTTPHARRAALLPIIFCLVGVAAGCPELNRWSGPSQDPFFSVADEATAVVDTQAGQPSFGATADQLVLPEPDEPHTPARK